MGISTFFGLNIGVNALESMQQAQSVASNNVANANTPGYVLEEANLAPTNPYPPADEAGLVGQFGQGVQVTDVARQTSAFVNQQDRANQGTEQMFTTHSSALTQIEGIYNEPSSNGIQNSLDQFFSSWQSLSSDPSSTAARQAVISQAQTVVQTFGTVTNQLEQLQSGLTTALEGPVGYGTGIGQTSLVAGQPSPPTQSNPAVPVASNVQFIKTPSPVNSQYQLAYTATGSSGAPSYAVQLETAGSSPTPIGSPVTVTAGGYQSLGDPASLQLGVDLPAPSSLYTGTLANGQTYKQTDTITVPNGAQIGQMNQYATQIDQLNQQITQIKASNENPNTLMDQRGLILDQMSQLANISYSETSTGALNVQLGSKTLVSDAGGTSPMTISDLNGVTSGSMAGNLQGIADTQKYLSKLDDFQQQFAAQINGVQTAGYGLNSNVKAPSLFGTTGQPTGVDGFGHSYLAVPTTFTPSDIAAAGSPNQPGDNSNALSVIQLQANANAFNGGTFDQGVAQMVSSLGVEAGSVQSSQKTAQALAQQSSNMRQSISGVDTNEEAAKMVQFQNSYNAAAKFISVFDQMLQTLINMVPGA